MAGADGIPERIGPYRILGILGQGGMGRVYKARHPRTERVVAIKQLREGFDGEQKARFAREAAVLGELDHPGLARLLDYDVETENPFIVSELIEGQSLTLTIGRGMPATRAVDLAIQIADALAVLHGRGLVHRDLKPDNVMIRPGDQAVLIDLGIAKHTGDFQKTMDRLTSDGVLIGTPGYFPPEGGMVPDAPPMDCFALGVTLYEMLTDRRPFAEAERLGLVAYLDCIRRGGYEPASSLVPTIPKSVDGVIARFLETDPRRRVHDGAEALRVLQDLAIIVVGARGDVPTREMVAIPRKSGKVSVTTVATTPARPPSGRTSQATPTPSSIAGLRPTRAAGLAFITVGTIVLVLSWYAVAKVRPTPERTATPTPSFAGASPDEPSSKATSDSAALARDLRSALHRLKFDSAWIETFASRHRAHLRSEPTTVASALKDELRHDGVLRLLEQFLSHAPTYFSNAGISETEKWATRAVLCDFEILEAFCDEHKLAWPVSFRIAERTRPWDEPVHPMELELSKGRTWGRHRGDSRERGYFPGRSIEDRWEIPTPSRSDRILVWFLMTKAQSRVLLDVSVGGAVRRILRPSGRKNPAAMPAISFMSMVIDGCSKRPDCVRGPHLFRPTPTHQEKNTYLGFWMPPALWKNPKIVNIKLIEVPLSASLDNPILWERYVTIFPRDVK